MRSSLGLSSSGPVGWRFNIGFGSGLVNQGNFPGLLSRFNASSLFSILTWELSCYNASRDMARFGRSSIQRPRSPCVPRPSLNLAPAVAVHGNLLQCVQ